MYGYMFQENYNYLLKRLGLNHSDVARALNVSSTAARAYGEEGSVPRPERMKKLAAFFNVPVDKLQYGTFEGSPFDTAVVTGESRGVRIPRLQLDELDDYLSGSLKSHQWFHCTYDVDLNSFAVIQQGDSMQDNSGGKSIPDGALVLIEPQAEPQPGSVVLAKIRDTGMYTIKRYKSDLGKAFLAPINPLYSSVPVDDNVEIVGVAKRSVVEIVL